MEVALGWQEGVEEMREVLAEEAAEEEEEGGPNPEEVAVVGTRTC